MKINGQSLVDAAPDAIWPLVFEPGALLQLLPGCEDVVSETFLAALRTVADYDPQHGTVYGWLLGIARNKLRDHWRKAAHRREEAGLEPGTLTDPQAAEPDQGLLVREVQDAVLDTLGRLDDDERLVLEWKYVERLSVREIATRLGRTEKAVEALLFRARAAFRAIHPQQPSQADSSEVK